MLLLMIILAGGSALHGWWIWPLVIVAIFNAYDFVTGYELWIALGVDWRSALVQAVGAQVAIAYGAFAIVKGIMGLTRRPSR